MLQNIPNQYMQFFYNRAGLQILVPTYSAHLNCDFSSDPADFY